MSAEIFNACDLRASQKVVQLEDWNAAQSKLVDFREELKRLEDEFDTLEHTNIALKLSLAEASASLQLATRLLASGLSALNPRAGLAKNVRAFLDSQRKQTESGASA